MAPQINFTDIHGGDKIPVPSDTSGGGVLSFRSPDPVEVLKSQEAKAKAIVYTVDLSVQQSGSEIWSVSGLSAQQNGNNFTWAATFPANPLTGKTLCTVRAVLKADGVEQCHKTVSPIEFVTEPIVGFTAESTQLLLRLGQEKKEEREIGDWKVLKFPEQVESAYIHFLLLIDDETSSNAFPPALYSILPLDRFLTLYFTNKTKIQAIHKRLVDTYVSRLPEIQIIIKAIGVNRLRDIVVTKTLKINDL